MTYLDRAIKDGYAIITGPENKQKIIYVTSDNHTENYNDPEEKVRAEFWAELIYEYDYPAHRIKVEVTIPDRVPTDRADIVIFSDDECKKPYAVVECKRDGVTDAEFLQAIEQGVGNATWVKLRASYEVNSRLSDLKIHSIIDKLNPNLRSIENFNGKQRVREFYAMSPEDAYSILEAIAEIHGCADKLKRIDMDEAQKQAEETAQEIDAEHKERQSPFRFSMCNIQPGEEIEYCNNPEIKCTVVDDKTVSYQGQSYSLSSLAQLLTGSKYSVAGPRYFKYKGEWLNDIRHRLEG